jgi:hypothetical protein
MLLRIKVITMMKDTIQAIATPEEDTPKAIIVDEVEALPQCSLLL